MKAGVKTRVLIAGGAGYIGSHTAKALANAGFEPVVLDNLSTGHAENVRWGPFVRADLSDEARIRNAIRDYEIGAVLHFAASALVGESMQVPRRYFRNNACNSFHLLNAMLDSGVERIVFSSTCATYGMPVRVPIPEDHPQTPVNPYGESKLFVERMLHWLGVTEQLSWVALRYFNAAGADPEGQLGEDHTPETHLIPRAIRAALAMQDPLDVYGSDYPTPDGTAIRDYVHVTDLADAHVSALRHLMQGGKSAALNLGTGTGHSVRQVIAMVEDLGGRPVPVRQCPRRAGDPATLIADAHLAGEILGWQPVYSNLRSIVETAWRWHSGRADDR